MKKFFILMALMACAAFLSWQNRIEILVWGAPKVRGLVAPTPDNVPIEWPASSETLAVPVTQRPPNIILILADDMGFNDVSLYNGGAADGTLMTPHIDSLANDGVRFNNGYSANAVCAPSRATIMTGRYSTRFGFEFTPFFKSGATIFRWMQEIDPPVLPSMLDEAALAALPEMQQLGMPSEQITIAEVLRDAGYYTAHIGKWHLGASAGMRPQDQGFADSLYMSGMLYLPQDHPEVVNAKRESNGIERMVWANSDYRAQFNGGENFEPDGYLTDYYTREAVKVIEANQHRPFFLYLAHWAIHNPLQALKQDYDALKNIEDHHLRVYGGMIRSLDRSVGEVVNALERLGLDENTLIVFTSDNGGANYIGLPDVNKPFRGWKLTHFEGGTHVPFMAKWPKRIAPNTVFDAPIHHIDVFHTIAAAAGVAIPTDRPMDGVDLMPYVTGEVAGVPHETLFWREGYHQSVLHRGWKLIRADKPAAAKWLFNLIEDPTEQINLVATHPQQVARLEALLAAHNAQQAQPMWPSVIQSPQLIDKHGGEAYAPGDEYIYWPN